ncbi:hypothetical protein ABE288_21065 [Bacillus salipaludis]|uniref:hypothetical protein n=1 Tax=Bacillus salipaludis TaxID=2547811 RepID=UPI003D1DB78D
MNKYDEYLKDVFSNTNVYKLGNELNNMLQNKFAVTSSNARKIISRACDKGLISSSKPVTFGKGQYVYFNNKAGLNINIVKELSKENRPPIYHLLTLLESNKGIISYYEGLKVTASPIKKEKEKSNTLNEILEILTSLKIVEIVKDSGIIYITLSSFKVSAGLITEHLNNMVTDCTFIPDIRNWLVKHNFIDNRYVVYRNKHLPAKGAEHNNYIWDAYAYTKSTGYNTVLGNSGERDDKNTLVVLDIVVYRTYLSCDVQGFLRRVQAIRSSAKLERKVLPIVVYQDIIPQAYKQLKGLGFIMLNLGSIYGGNIYPIIKTVTEIKNGISFGSLPSEDIAHNVDYTLSTIEQSGQTENLQNLKGALFEALMYPVVTRLYPDASIELGKILKRKNDDGTERNYEYDAIVRDFQNEEIVVFEFKGLKSTTEIPLKPFDKRGTVKWFFNTTLPFARDKLKSGIEFPVKGCYITTAKFSEEALEYFKKINTHKNVKPETHDLFYDGNKLIDLLKEKKLQHVVYVLERHFIKEVPSKQDSDEEVEPTHISLEDLDNPF